MWNKFKERYPKAYEVVQWGILLIAVAALVKTFI